MNDARMKEKNESEVLSPRQWMREDRQVSGVSRYIQVLWKLWEDGRIYVSIDWDIKQEKERNRCGENMCKTFLRPKGYMKDVA